MIGNVCYLLPAGGYSGGANSVVQEVSGLQKMGINAKIAVDDKNYETFTNAYASLPDIASGVRSYGTREAMKKILADSDIAVVTVATSVPDIISAWNDVPERKRPKLFYYIQDYEPLFFEKGSPDWLAAAQSYEHNLIMKAFAKTDWICETVERCHGMRVSRVKASIDHGTFFPLLTKPKGGKLKIAAMIRPSTPRRAPRRTCRVVNKIVAEYGEGVGVTTFGCNREQLRDYGLNLAASVQHLDRLTREQVAQVLRQTDIFLDLSDYQAFGRTGLEAMACGATPVLPMFGGASEYVRHRENGFLVDVRDEEEVFRVVREFAKSPSTTRRKMCIQAISTASEYTTRSACASIIDVLTCE
ncbi:glycosyltransferase family 4 protein [Nisaea sediminum]|uniref:glycosyltransferase family 4 protein n=1 Tax=Nisaea sediminum TaxID=2775867 RepID=UPI001867F3B2|nr:glycosyltransferase family 4 protein [Nisaea sediminum]